MINPMPGVTWRCDHVSGPTELPFDVAFVQRDHLRVINDGEETYIEQIIRAAMREGERLSGRSFLEQTRRMVLDGFPESGDILLLYPPVIDVESVTYVDGDGETQTLALGDDYQVELPQGPNAGYGRIRPAANTSWPSVRTQMGAVRITYTAGYVTADSPAVADIPFDLQQAMLLLSGEFYKQRSLSVQGTTIVPAIVQARDTFLSYRPY